ncbi:MAG: FMN-binding negative transcriptional regulator [Acidimicrobiales bacterium]
MYVPPNFKVDEAAAWRVVDDAGAGMLVINTDEGLMSVFVPVVTSEDRRTIRFHVARANAWWRAVEDGDEVLALFLAASAYVSPSLYPSRLDSPGVVPTWNYVACEVRGRLRVHDDKEWTSTQIHDLTDHFESGRSPRWHVEDSPAEYIGHQLSAIVGFELEVTSIVGKAKLSQNRPGIDHDNVRDTFSEGSLSERNVSSRMTLDT